MHELEHQLQEQETEANDVIAKWQETCAELEEKCANLESEAAHKLAANSESIVGHLEEKIGELRDKLHFAEQESARAEEGRHELVATLSELESNNKKLEEDVKTREREINVLTAKVEELRFKLREIVERAKDEDSVNTELMHCRDEISRLTQELVAEHESRGLEREQLVKDLENEKANHAETRDEVTALSKEIKNLRVESEDVVNQWTGKCHELI